jgi:hypothetical protein
LVLSRRCGFEQRNQPCGSRSARTMVVMRAASVLCLLSFLFDPPDGRGGIEL